MLLLLGLALAALGIVVYAVQLTTGNLAAPWYMPGAAMLGAVCVGLALWQGRTFWRAVALVAIVMLAGVEWAFLLMTRLPPYTGPVAVGRPFPAFKTTRADGTPFTQRDLSGEANNVFIFFRGRW